jgi:hypothetical protein
MARIRSPADFHCTEVLASSSASAASASLRAVCSARASSRLAFSSCVALSACSTIACRRGQALSEGRCGRPDLAGVAGARRQPLLEEYHLGVQVVEASTEMFVGGFGVACLPRPDGALTGRCDQPHRAVGVDASEAVRIV